MNLKYIDSLRGLAVLGVILVHCSQVGANNYPFLIANIFRNGALGVQLFFMISAFTLFLSYNNRKKSENNTKLNFFIRRFFRIAPLYYVAIGYYLFQNGFGPRPTLGDMDYVSNANIIANFLFIHSFNPYWINSIVPGGWSISVEMLFYCFLPLLATRITNFNKALVFLIIALALKMCSDFFITAIPHHNEEGYWTNFIFFYFPSQLPVFASGIVLYFLITQKGIQESLQWTYLFVLGLLLLVHQMLDYNTVHISVCLVYLFLILALSRRENKLIVNKFFIYLGKLSFSLYLFHFAAIHWMGQWGLLDLISSDRVYSSLLNFACRFALLLGFSIVGANVLYYVIEKPFLSFGKKLINFLEMKLNFN